MKKIFFRLYKLLIILKYKSIHNRFKEYTMIPQRIFCGNLDLVENYAIMPGAVVECGTWKGGMIGGMAYFLGKERHYYLFDSFEGLPPAKEIDGASAIAWQANTTAANYYDNCTASEQSAHDAMKLSGATNVSIVKGWFNETLYKTPIVDDIAVLRMDADWYDSTMEILNVLFPKVKNGGIIIIDDYYDWEGCSKAVHDYLSTHKREERIITSHFGICYLIKK